MVYYIWITGKYVHTFIIQIEMLDKDKNGSYFCENVVLLDILSKTCWIVIKCRGLSLALCHKQHETEESCSALPFYT
jgi:hypothetical protein